MKAIRKEIRTEPKHKHPASGYKPAYEHTKIVIRDIAANLERDPDALALHYFDKELDHLLQWQAFEIECELVVAQHNQITEREMASGELGYCFECGRKVSPTSAQCGACKEGIPPTPAPYDHSKHLRAPSSIKRQRFIDYNKND